ncbi:acetylxylan esterase [Streptomyces rugosispiralis]|uniref:Acetylxylan esterase n=1 Tax=Streptomyces rugosispiralis TaxID=2967341 RepID=A0ABT1V5F0_9ACTN|nr:acetylxylan esterase [Streptomyces rugosispiralis]MCQ8192625.1 acetylxylan esterase [Streptomyces rugosispiralis]
MPLPELLAYRPDPSEPEDFDAFWRRTLDEARAAAAPTRYEPYDSGLRTVEVFDMTFSGFAGQPVRGWLLLPRHTQGRLPCVVQYIGYNGGRGLPHEYLTWSAAGYAHLVMDNRGQGSGGFAHAETSDPDPLGDPFTPGYLTRGVASPETYYYRRLFTDAARAVDAAREHPRIDPERLVLHGGSQGGGIAIAAAGLSEDITAVTADVPFLCHFRRAVQITDGSPYKEIATYCRSHRLSEERVFSTLDYFDGVNLAARATAPVLFSAALMDPVCPPSTVFAAYHRWAGDDKEIKVWKFNGHEGGGAHQTAEQIRFLDKTLI